MACTDTSCRSRMQPVAGPRACSGVVLAPTSRSWKSRRLPPSPASCDGKIPLHGSTRPPSCQKPSPRPLEDEIQSRTSPLERGAGTYGISTTRLSNYCPDGRGGLAYHEAPVKNVLSDSNTVVVISTTPLDGAP